MNYHIPPPGHLCRYRSIATPEQLQNLERMLLYREFWFSCPLDFNDPFDCRFRISAKGSDEKRRRLVKVILKDTPDRGVSLSDADIDRIAKNLEFEMNPHHMLMDNLRQLGVLSMTTKNDNPLMWSHYADSHRGVCVRLSFPPETVAYEVRYSEAIPVINLCRLILENPSPAERRVAGVTKSKVWEYEDEWRIVRKGGPGLATLIPDAVSGIVFGCRITVANRQKVLDIVSKLPKRIDCFQAVMNRASYALEILPVADDGSVEFPKESLWADD